MNFIVGVGYTIINVRYSRSLKDKRKVMRSIIQRLKNEGFSVTENGYENNTKLGSIGFAYMGGETTEVNVALEKVKRIFIGDFEVIRVSSSVFDYSTEDDLHLSINEEGEV